jgi:transcriptional antiterminator NusG
MITPSAQEVPNRVISGSGLEPADDLAWYVVHTQSRQESRVETDLGRRGLKVFLPRITVRSRRRDRFKLLEVPLFPGYLFVHTDLRLPSYHDIIKHRGVIRILGVKHRCIPVPDGTVAAIQAVLASGRPYDPWDSLTRGMRVKIADGALAGTVGTILRKKPGKRRLVVMVDLLGRGIAVDLAEEMLEPYA